MSKHFFALLLPALFAVAAHSNADTPQAAPGIHHISARTDRLLIEGQGTAGKVQIVELAPFQNTDALAKGKTALTLTNQSSAPFSVSLPRFDHGRDRIYSGFVLAEATKDSSSPHPAGSIRYVEEMQGISKFNEPFPKAASKKGLQVQMIDDAIALGVKHAALNVNLAQLLDIAGGANDESWDVDGKPVTFHRSYLDQLDRQVKQLSDANIVVTFILLYYTGGDAAQDKIMQHPHYDPSAPNHLTAFNTSTEEGLRYYKACIEFLADRYSRTDHPHGRVVNFIVGNEVNSHWHWYNMGRVPVEQFTEDYMRTLRVTCTAVRKASSSARVYLSLEHHWNISYEKDTLRTFQGKTFIDLLNRKAKAEGDFDWNVAYHPYPENLFECRTWNDKTAIHAFDSPRITFKNLEVLPQYLQQPDFLYRGEQRHIILSEQGFHTPDGPDGEKLQAAAYCYAYYKVAHLDGIDAFILHRHVDHKHEGGLKLGLWRWAENTSSPSQPGAKKYLYDVFRFADTPQWEQAFQFALPVIGIKKWDNLLEDL